MSSLPIAYEGGALAPTVRKIGADVTLERVIKYGQTPGCRGCVRVAEGVPHSDECHERFRVLLEKDRAIPPTPAPSTPAPSTPVVRAVIRQDASLSCVKDDESVNSVDCWEFYTGW